MNVDLSRGSARDLAKGRSRWCRPGSSRHMAAVCRMTWGDIFFSVSVGHAFAAVAACLARRFSSASRLSGVPARAGNSGHPGAGAFFQPVLQHRDGAGGSGVIRCLRPFPRQLTWAPVPRWTSFPCRETSSEARRPVCRAVASIAWSRRPAGWTGQGRRAARRPRPR